VLQFVTPPILLDRINAALSASVAQGAQEGAKAPGKSTAPGAHVASRRKADRS
jgi:hypothetical protein